MEKMKQPQMDIDFTSTDSVDGFNGTKLFGQAFVIRKISKFVAQTDEDAFMPIPVFYDLESKQILIDTLPKELREEYKDMALEV